MIKRENDRGYYGIFIFILILFFLFKFLINLIYILLYLIYIFINKIIDKIFKILNKNNQILNKNFEKKKRKNLIKLKVHYIIVNWIWIITELNMKID